jgi:peptidoglycan/LPS O-acetylase OafA/YrhL
VRQQSSYIPTLDGWRAFAVLGVILYHGRFGFFRDNSFAEKLASRGEAGVDVFFAISGFLICGLLLKEFAREGGLSLGRFYIRRFFRILPPYCAALVGIGLLSIFGAIHLNHWELPSCLLFYRNYKPLGMDEYGGFYTAHFWSLAVEEHFYLIWPVLLLAVKPKRAGKVAFLLAAVIFSWRCIEERFHVFASILPQAQANLLTRTDTRMDALLWGCLAAIYFPEIKRIVERIRFSQLWLPVLIAVLVVEALQPPGMLLLRGILLPALVLTTVLQPRSWLGRVLEWRPICWIGTISYSLYLWQELFLPEVVSVKAHGAFSLLQQLPWNMAAILACACLSRYLLEIPMTRLGHRLGASLPGRGGPLIHQPHAWLRIRRSLLGS